MRSPVLIANRGEIAVRIARTVHALGLRSVAVFTDEDADALHVDVADVAVRIPSYLDGAAIVAAAGAAGAQAVHPGYGFLAENAGFAEAVAAAGLTWIGPPAGAIEVMGDKARAKAVARDAGVPVVPGVEGEDLDLDELRAFAGEHGFPIVIKAVAGGGGKGMRVVRAEAELERALDAARREAQSAFGDGRVLVERYLERPRHIEVQVLADAHGTVLHLGERECSLQRRHQKVVEEAPSPVVDPELRARMGASAVALATACGYEGAGTVEFIATGDARSFFFLEMNTRLQVEHPVTELVYGVDLVEQQLRVAAGEPLGLDQDALVPLGHAIETRLYAEDPANGFLPATGTIRRWREPAGSPGVRIDSGVREGSEVTTSYDPMLAKVIAYGDDRDEALRRLDRALGDLEVLGVATNAAFTQSLLRRDDVRAGEQDTGLLERVLHADDGVRPPDTSVSGGLTPGEGAANVDTGVSRGLTPWDLLPAAAVAAYRADTAAATTAPGPWRRRLADHGEIRVTPTHVTAAGRTHEWSARGERITLDGISRRYAVALDGDDAVHIARDGHVLEARTERKVRSGAGALAGSLEAPMPGTVLLVHVTNGDAVAEGDVLLVLESMKMELSITAPTAGTVEGLELQPGDRVTHKQPLLAVTTSEDAA